MYSMWIGLTKPPVTGKSVVSILDQREYESEPYHQHQNQADDVMGLSRGTSIPL